MLQCFTIRQGPESGRSEVVCQWDTGNSITSGGGFSSFYARPEWQNAAVNGYIAARDASGEIPVPGYDTSKRGYPDLSLAGSNYLVRVPSFTDPTGETAGVAGTSASCPVAAAFFSNINAARLAAGKGSIGWVNPVLYAKGSLFVNDITFGNNKSPIRGPRCAEGYYATIGWDPTTGLGSVDYAKMHQTFLSLGEINGMINMPPSSAPTQRPPTPQPTRLPTMSAPSATPSAAPTTRPSVMLTITPTALPSMAPTMVPTSVPSSMPSAAPTFRPTAVPTETPSAVQTTSPSAAPTISPTIAHTSVPSIIPMIAQTGKPTSVPSRAPCVAPTVAPTSHPSVAPATSTNMVVRHSPTPSHTPTVIPTISPTTLPTLKPTLMPSGTPSMTPTAHFTMRPSAVPSKITSHIPSGRPSVQPTAAANKIISEHSAVPTRSPSVAGQNFRFTKRPTKNPVTRRRVID